MKSVCSLLCMIAISPLFIHLPAQAAAACDGPIPQAGAFHPRVAVIRGHGHVPMSLDSQPSHHPYLVGGDKVIVLSQDGDRACVTITSPTKAANSTTGWIDSSKMALIIEPVGTPDWSGDWRSGPEKEVRVSPVSEGTYKVDGNATFGASDPERAARGAVNVGEIAGIIRPVHGKATLEGDCHVEFWELPPYLLVNDDGKCGGLNVTFDGFYRRPNK